LYLPSSHLAKAALAAFWANLKGKTGSLGNSVFAQPIPGPERINVYPAANIQAAGRHNIILPW
jgi:hypothetical protein